RGFTHDQPLRAGGGARQRAPRTSQGRALCGRARWRRRGRARSDRIYPQIQGHLGPCPAPVSGRARARLRRLSRGGRGPAMSAAPSGDGFTETQVRVRYAETDQMGVVYYANYFIWFEVGRVEHLRTRGISYKDMENDDGC